MLFDDNLGFFGFTIPSNMKLETNSNLASVKDGFAKGNMFNDLYDPYKNYRYQELTANNKQEELLLEIMVLSFAINDLNLYLDIYPNDREALELFNQYRMQADEYTKKYESKYGPLELTSNSLNTFPWAWDNAPWPWEKK